MTKIKAVVDQALKGLDKEEASFLVGAAKEYAQSPSVAKQILVKDQWERAPVALSLGNFEERVFALASVYNCVVDAVIDISLSEGNWEINPCEAERRFAELCQV